MLVAEADGLICGFLWLFNDIFSFFPLRSKTKIVQVTRMPPTMSSISPKIKSALVIGGCGSLSHRTVEQHLKLEPTPQVAVFDIQTGLNRIQGVEYYNVDITSNARFTLHLLNHTQRWFFTGSTGFVRREVPPLPLLDSYSNEKLTLYMGEHVMDEDFWDVFRE